MNEFKKTMDGYLNHIDLNKKWINSLTAFYFKLFTKDENTMAFFGEGLWGVYPIYFTKEDTNTWYDEILQIDDLGLRNEIKRIVSENDKIEANWQRANDLVNLTLFYLTHRFLTSKLRDNEIENGCKMCLNILLYKFYSSLQGHRFRYDASKDIAEAAYSQLTRKVLVKQLGNWKAVFDFRSICIIRKDGIHYNTLINFDDDYQVIWAISEIQNRTRKMANFLTEEFHNTHKAGERIGTTSKIISDSEEGERLKDTTKEYDNYKNYLQIVIKDRGNLVKNDLIGVIEKDSHRLPKNILTETLNWLSDANYSNLKNKLDTFLNSTLEYSFKVIRINKYKTNQLQLIIKKLKSMYLSSRTTDERLIEAKENGLSLIETSDITRSKSTQISLRCSLMLYIVLRTLAKNFYG